MVSEQPKGRGGWAMEVQGCWLHEGDRQRLTVGVLSSSLTKEGGLIVAFGEMGSGRTNLLLRQDKIKVGKQEEPAGHNTHIQQK